MAAAGIIANGGIIEVGANAIVKEACAAELGGRDSTDGGLMDEGGVMSAMYSGLRPQVALVLEVGVATGKAEGLVAWKMIREM